MDIRTDLSLSEARTIAGTKPFRAPHHTASYRGCADECHLAAGGVLYLDGPFEFCHQTIQAIAHRLAHFPVASLPLLIVLGPVRAVTPMSDVEHAAYVDRCEVRTEGHRAVLQAAIDRRES